MRPDPRLAFLLLAVLAGAAGCISSRQRIEAGVADDREAAAVSWSNSLAGAETDRPLIEGILTLPDALTLALSNNKQLRSTLLEKDIAAGRVTEAYGQALPTLSAAGGYTRVGPADSRVRIPVASDPYDLYSASLRVRQPLYRGGAIGSAITASRLYAYWADETIRGGVQAAIYQTAAAYYEVLLAERLQAVAQASLDSAESQLASARSMAAAGTASRYDVLRSEVAVANTRSEVIRQQNEFHLARNRLFQVMGVVAATNLTVSGILDFEKCRPDLAEALRAAHLHRPDLTRGDLEVRLQRESLAVARSRYYPAVDAVGSHDWLRADSDTEDSGRWLRDWAAGVEVSVPIFDGLAREGRIAQERALLRRREEELAGAEERVLLEIRQSLASLEDAEKVVESQALNLSSAREALKLAEAGFREGVNTPTDLADARAALRLAEGLHAQALHGHIQSRLYLRYAMGALDPADADPAHLKEFEPGARP